MDAIDMSALKLHLSRSELLPRMGWIYALAPAFLEGMPLHISQLICLAKGQACSFIVGLAVSAACMKRLLRFRIFVTVCPGMKAH